VSIDEARKQRLRQFAAWVAEHVTGDEKGQAQLFVDRLFQAFGQKGALEVGGPGALPGSTASGGMRCFAPSESCLGG
jgi:hypothetical protein